MIDKKKTRWTEVDVLVESTTNVGVKITRNRNDFNIQIIRSFGNDRHSNFIPVPVEDEGDLALEHVIFSLVKAAKERIAEERAKSKEKKDKHPKRQERKQGKGLSELARDDAQKAGHDYKGPTARKKEKKRA